MTDNVHNNRQGQPADPMPPFEVDLAELAWLQCSDQLSQDCTGYVCAALVQWGGAWPDPAPPPDCDHLTAPERIAEQLSDRSSGWRGFVSCRSTA